MLLISISAKIGQTDFRKGEKTVAALVADGVGHPKCVKINLNNILHTYYIII